MGGPWSLVVQIDRPGRRAGERMIERIIEYSARNRFLVVLLVAFATAVGVWSIRQSPLDAIPDLSDVQVIVFTDWPGRSPDIVEDQITYPIISTMIAAPKVKYVRGESMFGYSFVNVVFQDGTDLYWARTRVLEYMQGIGGRLPEGVSPRLGPDATGVGWVYEYALVDRGAELTRSRISARFRTGTSATGCRPCLEWPRSPRSAASSSSIRSTSSRRRSSPTGCRSSK
jgi:Cu/Ag efflux pump CusA